MEIKIDTALMQLMSNKALLARDAMEDAMRSADAITVHDDWNCAERDLINESVTKIKKNNNTTCTNMELYSENVHSIAAQLDEFDKSLLSKFSGVDSSIGKMYQIGNAVETNNAQAIKTEELQQISVRLEDNTYWNQYHLRNMNNPISVVSFKDASDILSGADNNPSQSDLMKKFAEELGFDRMMGD